MHTININKWFGYIELEGSMLLILSLLHIEGKITDQKLKGQFAALRNGTLQAPKRTYHCDINDQWYNSEPVSDIWSDLLRMTSGTHTI